MENSIEKLEEKIDALTSKLDRIAYHLYNDEGAGTLGTIKRVDNIDRRLEKVETDKKIQSARLGMLGVFGAIIFEIGKYLFMLLKHA